MTTIQENIDKSSEDFVEFFGKEIESNATSTYKKNGRYAASIYLRLVANLSIHEVTKYLHGLPFHHYAVVNKLNWKEWEPGIFTKGRMEEAGLL